MSRFDGPAFEEMVRLGADALKQDAVALVVGLTAVECEHQARAVLVAALSAIETRGEAEPRPTEEPSKLDTQPTEALPSTPDQCTSWLWLQWAEEAGLMHPTPWVEDWAWSVNPIASPTPGALHEKGP